MRHRSTLALALALAAGGCYHYLPSSPQEVAPGQSVRLRVTSEEAARYTDLRLSDPRLLTGTVLDRDASQVMLETMVGQNDREHGSRSFAQRLSVPLSAVLDVEQRELDKGKTGFLVGGSAAIVTVAIIRVARGSGSERPGGGDVAEARRIPFVLFRLPF